MNCAGRGDQYKCGWIFNQSYAGVELGVDMLSSLNRLVALQHEALWIFDFYDKQSKLNQRWFISGGGILWQKIELL